MRKARESCTILFLISVLVGSAHGRDSGELRGKVIDQKGRAVAQARVIAVPEDAKVKHSALITGETDEGGNFVLPNLQWGPYRLFAMKESAGFPNTFFSFYSNDIFPRFEVSPNMRVANVVLRIMKAASIKGTIKDAVTGKGLTATFQLSRKENPEYSITTAFSSTYELLIPADTNVILKVSASGFSDWYYSGSRVSHHVSAIRLHAGQQKKISIILSAQ